MADTFLVKSLEGILRQQLFLFIIIEEFSDIIPWKAKSHLGQVIGSKAEEVVRKYQTEVINITDKSIEETAFLIEDYLKKLDMIGEAK